MALQYGAVVAVYGLRGGRAVQVAVGAGVAGQTEFKDLVNPARSVSVGGS